MNLVLDLGNTNFKLAIYDGEKMIKFSSNSQFEIKILEEVLIKYPKIKNLCISSSVDVSLDLRTFCNQQKINYLQVDQALRLPININYHTPESLGSDRIALAVGAIMKYANFNSYLVVDLGTCITYDLVLKKNYIGGQISPGLNMRLFSLNSGTEKLPIIKFSAPSKFIGLNTQDAILSGVYHGVLNEMQGIIQTYKSRYPDIVVILTGGDREVFKKKLKNINFLDSYLLMDGLNYIIASNE